MANLYDIRCFYEVLQALPVLYNRVLKLSRNDEPLHPKYNDKNRFEIERASALYPHRAVHNILHQDVGSFPSRAVSTFVLYPL
jgi:hypothetical protein